MSSSLLSEISPLYEFWESKQNQNDVEERLLKMNINSRFSYLFKEEPYKWENLFQCIIREVANGDNTSIRGLRVLIDSLNEEEREKTILRLLQKKVLSEDIISKIKNIDFDQLPKKTNFIRFLKILMSIYFNPYMIHLRGPKRHLYEYTGYSSLILRRFLFQKFNF